MEDVKLILISAWFLMVSYLSTCMSRNWRPMITMESFSILHLLLAAVQDVPWREPNDTVRGTALHVPCSNSEFVWPCPFRARSVPVAARSALLRLRGIPWGLRRQTTVVEWRMHMTASLSPTLSQTTTVRISWRTLKNLTARFRTSRCWRVWLMSCFVLSLCFPCTCACT